MQLNVAGPEHLQNETRETLRRVLTTFRARSNWPEVPSE